MHSIIIGILLYLFMIYIGQNQRIAENRSILIAALVLVYMILFGHGLPSSNLSNL
jgi:ABC-type phosphate transport system permease subunit